MRRCTMAWHNTTPRMHQARHCTSYDSIHGHRLVGRRKDLRIRRLSETGPRVKSSPENESMPSFTQPEVVASNSYAYDAQREKSNPFDSSSSSSSKRRQNRTEPSFSSSDSSDSTPQKPSSKRTANLNFLVPSYDSLVKTGSSTKKPIIMIDSEEDWIESESESNED